LLVDLPGAVRRIILFGSRARGDAGRSSDMDILVVLEDCHPSVMERARAARYEIMEKHAFRPLISLLLLSEQDWQTLPQRSAGLKQNIEQEGILLWPTP